MQAHIPIKFWEHCVLEAEYLINELPSLNLSNKSPYEVFFEKNSSINHLRIIRCLCFAKDVTRSDKLGFRSNLVVHMGYSE